MIETAYKHGEAKTAAYYVARNRVSWPGCYDLALLTTDGGFICHDCVRDNWGAVISSTREGCTDGWEAAATVCADTFENGETCDHCGRWLDAYNDDPNGAE